MLVKESLKDILKPKPSDEISAKIASMSVEEKQEVLFDRGMDYFMGDFEGFFNWLEERYPEDKNRLWDGIISTIYTLGLNPTDESGNDEEIDADWVFNSFETDWLLQEVYLDSMKEENIDDALSFLIPGYKVNENFDILAPKSEDEIFADLHNVSGEKMLSMLEEHYNENWEEVVVDFYRYFGRDKFVRMFSEMLMERIRHYM